MSQPIQIRSNVHISEDAQTEKDNYPTKQDKSNPHTTIHNQMYLKCENSRTKWKKKNSYATRHQKNTSNKCIFIQYIHIKLANFQRKRNQRIRETNSSKMRKHTWAESKWSRLIISPSITNMVTVNTPASICLGSTAIGSDLGFSL